METFFTGEIAMELVKELIKVIRRAYLCKPSAEKLKRSIEAFLPVIREIQYSGLELPQVRQAQLSELVDQLTLGLKLARKASCSSRWNVYKSLQLARRMEKVEKWVERWVERQMPAHVLADVHHLRVDSARRLERIERRIQEGVGLAVGVGVGSPPAGRQTEMMEMMMAGMEGLGIGEDGGIGIGAGLRVGKEKVKEALMSKEGQVVGIVGIGGSGKTTLAKEICRDYQIQSHFDNRIFIETVSQTPNLESLKLKLWQQISGQPKSKGLTLVVLDDVWSEVVLKELVFRVTGCKTLVVSRFKFPAVFDCTYEMDLLSKEEALSLFCYSAFDQQSVPLTADKKLVKQVVAECKGLPLALKVIGASLRGQPPKIWASAKGRLSRGETISESHEVQLLDRMAASIECLSSKVRECFLDLGAFPEDKKIPLDVLINMWMEIHDLDEEDAYAILIELSNKALLNLVKDAQNRSGDMYSGYSELSVTQHDVLRDLALLISNRDALNKRRRLIMPRKEEGLPKIWERGKDQPFEAQIVSIHTGEMKESAWFPMYFPKAEVLILNFSSDMYFLPPFIGTMPKLKALVLINYGNSSTVLRNLSVFTSLDDLRSLWFEKITVPPLPITTIPLQSLRKIFLVLCELNKSFKGSVVDLPRTFPRLCNITIDHCVDLDELPPSICKISSLESISITNCHDLCELPCELGRLNSLQILQVSACLALKKLPQSVCQLKGLKHLDVSQCVNLRCLPDDIGRLTSLEKIDMRVCPQIRIIPMSVLQLRSLGHVICDEEMAFAWKDSERNIPDLRVQVAEESFDLDWLVE